MEIRTKNFIKYNAHPKGLNVKDCVVRSVCTAFKNKVTYKYTYSEGREKYLEFKSIQNKNLRILYSLEPVLNKYVYIIKELDNQISHYDRIEDALTYIGHYCKP